MNVFGSTLESACVHVSVCVQNTSFCQSAGEGIKSHLVTALLYNTVNAHTQNQSIHNAGVAFFKGDNERNEFFEKINKQ